MADPFWPGVVFYDPFDGFPGQSAAWSRDLSASEHALEEQSTATVRPLLSGARSRFGLTSLDVAGPTNRVGVFTGPSEDWNLGADDFTVELFYSSNNTASGSGRVFFSNWIESGNERGWEFYRNSQNRSIGFRYSTDGADDISVTSSDVSAWGTGWFHLCAMRDGDTLYLFLDGVQVASADVTGVTFHAADAPLYIGLRTTNTFEHMLPGFINEARITKGAARYDPAGFSPPDEPFEGAEDPTPGRIDQAPMLIVAEGMSQTRISQAPQLIVILEGQPARLTQAPMLVVGHANPRVTRRADVWLIERRDGVRLAFTSHDEPLTFRGMECSPCGSLDPGAVEESSAIGDTGNVELRGLISSERITEADLYGGLYDDAYVEVWRIPWGDDLTEAPRRIAAGWCGTLTHGVAGFQIEVLGPGTRLSQQALVMPFEPGCRRDFGSPQAQLPPGGCGVDVEALQTTGEVLSAANRARIVAAISDPETAPQWANGKIIWTSGRNDGVRGEVKSVDFGSGEIVLWSAPPYLPEPGDEFILRPGCDKRPETCALYGNLINFGGFRDVPGTDAIMETPDAKY